MDPEKENQNIEPEFEQGSETELHLMDENREFAEQIQSPLPMPLLSMLEGVTDATHEVSVAAEKIWLLAAIRGEGSLIGAVREKGASNGGFEGHAVFALPAGVLERNGATWEEIEKEWRERVVGFKDWAQERLSKPQED